jgi:hypothetical protein
MTTTDDRSALRIDLGNAPTFSDTRVEIEAV